MGIFYKLNTYWLGSHLKCFLLDPVTKLLTSTLRSQETGFFWSDKMHFALNPVNKCILLYDNLEVVFLFSLRFNQFTAVTIDIMPDVFLKSKWDLPSPFYSTILLLYQILMYMYQLSPVLLDLQTKIWHFFKSEYLPVIKYLYQ